MTLRSEIIETAGIMYRSGCKEKVYSLLAFSLLAGGFEIADCIMNVVDIDKVRSGDDSEQKFYLNRILSELTHHDEFSGCALRWLVDRGADIAKLDDTDVIRLFKKWSFPEIGRFVSMRMKSAPLLADESLGPQLYRAVAHHKDAPRYRRLIENCGIRPTDTI